MQLPQKILYLPTILAIAILSLTGCGGEDQSAASGSTTEVMGSPSAETSMDSAKETMQAISDSVVGEANIVSAETKEAAMKKVDETTEAATQEVQDAVDSANDAASEKVDSTMKSFTDKLGQ